MIVAPNTHRNHTMMNMHRNHPVMIVAPNMHRNHTVMNTHRIHTVMIVAPNTIDPQVRAKLATSQWCHIIIKEPLGLRTPTNESTGMSEH